MFRNCPTALCKWSEILKKHIKTQEGKKMEKLLQVLNEVRSDVDFANEGKLIDNGILDSFDIIQVVTELNDAFDIEISVEDLVPENFNTAYAMMELIQRLQQED